MYVVFEAPSVYPAGVIAESPRFISRTILASLDQGERPGCGCRVCGCHRLACLTLRHTCMESLQGAPHGWLSSSVGLKSNFLCYFGREAYWCGPLHFCMAGPPTSPYASSWTSPLVWSPQSGPKMSGQHPYTSHGQQSLRGHSQNCFKLIQKGLFSDDIGSFLKSYRAAHTGL